MDKRNYGIDIARLLSMFFVVLLHNLGRGGVLDWTLSSPRSLAFATLENVAIVAVDVFALISGYLSSGRKLRPWRLFDLWSSALFWSATLAIIGLIRGADLGIWTVRAFFPLLGNVYWYLSAYFVLQFLLPLIGAGAEGVGRKETSILTVLLIMACSIIGFTERRGIGDGYTAFWLMALWLAGRVIRENRSAIIQYISTRRLIVALILLPLCVTWFEWRDVAEGYDPSRWLSYMSPTAIIQAICLFELLIRIKVRKMGIRKLLTALSESALGVYLIDSSGWLYGFWLNDRFKWINQISTRYGIPLILGVSVLMFVVFLLAECVRRYLATHLMRIARE